MGRREYFKSLKNIDILSALSTERSVFFKMHCFDALAIASIEPMAWLSWKPKEHSYFPLYTKFYPCYKVWYGFTFVKDRFDKSAGVKYHAWLLVWATKKSSSAIVVLSDYQESRSREEKLLLKLIGHTIMRWVDLYIITSFF